MDRKTLISLIVGGISALLLICILLVGFLDGIWPWDGITAYNRLITNEAQNAAGPRETTTATEASADAENDSNAPSRPSASEVNQDGAPPALPDDDTPVGIEIDDVEIPTEDEDKKDDDKKDDNKNNDNKNEDNKNEDNKNEDNKDEGNKDEGNKDEGNKDEGNKDEGNKDEGNKDEGNKDEGNKDEDNKNDGKDYDGAIDFSDLFN